MHFNDNMKIVFIHCKPRRRYSAIFCTRFWEGKYVMRKGQILLSLKTDENTNLNDQVL